LVLVPVLLSLGRGEASNAVPCEDWVDSDPCGEFDFGEIIDCPLLYETNCDTSEYFDCLTDELICEEETSSVDLAGWSSCAAEAEACWENRSVTQCYLHTWWWRCGEFAVGSLVDCEALDRHPCDLTPYYECLRENTACDEAYSMPDVSGWSACDAVLEEKLERCDSGLFGGCNGG